MIDRSDRNKAISLLERALTGKITNWEFDDSWPQSKDRALKSIEEYLWLFYNDNSKSRLNVTDQDPNNVELFKRCIAFLSSDLEYKWPEYNFRRTGRSYLKALFQKKTDKERWETFALMGEIEVWPFIKKEDLERE